MKDENQKTQRKRKNTSTSQQHNNNNNPPIKYQQLELELELSLYLPYDNNVNTPPQPNSTDPNPNPNPNPSQPTSSKPQRARRNPTRATVKTETVPAPYPWATDRRARVHTMKYLLDNGIQTISGEVHCKKCEQSFTIEYDLKTKFEEIAMFVVSEQEGWHDRAPKKWTDYTLPTCKLCGEEKSCKPVISEKKRSINWLFLLLGQVLGCCTLEQLKYFCKHTNIHRTGAKNRVLLYTYLALCKQLQPNGPFQYQAIKLD